MWSQVTKTGPAAQTAESRQLVHKMNRRIFFIFSFSSLDLSQINSNNSNSEVSRVNIV